MTDRRLAFHNLLCEILSCPIEGEQCRCYFQPPESIKMNYPAIVYSLDDIDKTYANDGVYLSNRRYAVTVIDKDRSYLHAVREQYIKSYGLCTDNHVSVLQGGVCGTG